LRAQVVVDMAAAGAGESAVAAARCRRSPGHGRTGEARSDAGAFGGARGFRRSGAALAPAPTGAEWRAGPPSRRVARNWALLAHGFKLLFDARGKYDTGFKKCMLPGNINDRIVVFANKHEGFEGHLFSKTGQIGG